MRLGKKKLVIVLSILAGIIVWIADALLDFLFFYDASFMELLFPSNPSFELYIRIIILAVVLIFGFICAWIIGRLESSEKELQKKGEQLAVLNKELEAFNYSVSQDLKVPLRHIQGYCEIISEYHGEELSTESRHLFEKAVDATKQMHILVDRLIQLSKATVFEIKRKNVDLSVIVQQICRDLQAWDPGSQVRFDIAQNIFGDCDETLMRIALFSLIGKAWKLGKQADDASIHFSSVERESLTYIIEQRGADVSSDEIRDLLNPIHHLQWNPDEEALGLSVASRIISRHGGKIWAEHPGDRAVNFLFTLGDGPLSPANTPSLAL